MTVRIERADPASDEARALIALHLAGMHENSPPEDVHALGVEALRVPGVHFFVARGSDGVLGMGALKDLGDGTGELKSMRVLDAARGQGVGFAMLTHLLGVARSLGLRTVFLETGTGPAFIAAHRLYERSGFTRCGPFGDYQPSDFSVFFQRAV